MVNISSIAVPGVIAGLLGDIFDASARRVERIGGRGYCGSRVLAASQALNQFGMYTRSYRSPPTKSHESNSYGTPDAACQCYLFGLDGAWKSSKGATP